MKALLQTLKRKLFLISFLFASAILVAKNLDPILKFTGELFAPEDKVKTEITAPTEKINLAQETVFEFATVETDLPDYSPGQTVTITGEGWTPGETVELNIVSDCGCVNLMYEAIADEYGFITNSSFTLQDNHLGTTFFVYAKGQTSLLEAQTSFHDAITIWSNPITGIAIDADAENPYTTGDVNSSFITVSGIGKGTGVNGTPTNNRYNTSSWNTTSLDANAYYSFTITPNAGYHINFNDFQYISQRSSQGPNSFAVRSDASSDNFTTDIGSPTTGTTPSTANSTIALNTSPYQNITSAISFRIFGWDATNVNGTFSVNSFTFSGAILGTSVTSLTGFSACVNNPGTAQFFTVNGEGLTPSSTITIAPSANYELSTTSDVAGFQGAGNVTLTTSVLGAVSGTVWVRLKANATSGTYNGETINVSGGGFSSGDNINVTVSGEVTGQTYYEDADEDGYGNPSSSTQACTQPTGYVSDNTDCDDGDDTIYPGATETPDDLIDQDCDGFDLKTWYRDSDEDGYGDAGTTTTANTQPMGYVSDNTDCDDGDDTIYPGAPEVCNGIDDDCDGSVDEGFPDYDNDGMANCVDPDDDNDGSLDGDDCQPLNPAVYPGAPEICSNGVDDDCDGILDESTAPTGATTSANNFCADAGGTLDLTATGGSLGEGAVVKWYTGSCGGTCIGTGSPLNISKPTTTTTYYARYVGDCNTTDCASVTVTVNPLPTLSGATLEEAVCAGEGAQINLSGLVPNTTISVTYHIGAGSDQTATGVAVNGLGEGSFTTVNLTDADDGATLTITEISITSNTPACSETFSEDVTIQVLEPTVIVSQTTGPFVYIYGCTSPVLNVTATGESTPTYQWYKNDVAIDGETNASYQVPDALPVGNYTINVVVSSDCGDITSDDILITVNPQEADPAYDGDPYYTGPSMAFTANSTSNTATFTLPAFVKNSNNDNCGDIATARVSFFYRIAGSGPWTKVPNGQNLPVNYVDPQHPSAGGTASVVAQLNIGNATCELFDILVILSGNYVGNNESELSQVSISKPQPGGTISGGAKLNSSSSTGSSTGFVKGSGKSELGFFVNYALKAGKAQNPKGKVNLTVKSYRDKFGNVTGDLHYYKITSNAIASMNIAGAKATFTSKANIAEIIDCENNIYSPIEGNCTMVMELEDLSACTSNQWDKVGIVVYRNAGGIWYSNNYTSQGITAPTAICSGCIYVSGSSLPACTVPGTIDNSITRSGTMEVPVEVRPFSVKAYPNPTEHQFTLYLEGGNDEKLSVTVYDAIGRMVKKIERGDSHAPIRFGEDLKVGAYIVEIRQGGNRKTIKLLKQ